MALCMRRAYQPQSARLTSQYYWICGIVTTSAFHSELHGLRLPPLKRKQGFELHRVPDVVCLSVARNSESVNKGL